MKKSDQYERGLPLVLWDEGKLKELHKPSSCFIFLIWDLVTWKCSVCGNPLSCCSLMI